MPSLKIAASSGASVAFLASEKHSADKSVVNKVTSSVEMLRTGKLRCRVCLCVVFFLSAQPNQTDAPGTITFGTNDRYYPVPGMEPNGASAVAIGASFSWREIPRDRLILGKVLGEGEFGMVVKGELTEDDGRTIPCAVKQLKRKSTL